MDVVTGVELECSYRAGDGQTRSRVASVPVIIMSNSRSYPVTPVALQYSSPTLVAHSYSSHGHADILPLSTTLGLIPTQSLLHLTIYPALM